MTSPLAQEKPDTPDWSHCGHAQDPRADPTGCRGIRVRDHPRCLAHLKDAERRAYLGSLEPGADVDHRGTPFSPELLAELLAAVRDPATGQPSFGTAVFEAATFSEDVRFDRAQFGSAWFAGAGFAGTASFGAVTFHGEASFAHAVFSKDAWFGAAVFGGEVWFAGTGFSGDAAFLQARFDRASRLGPLQCEGQLDLSEAVFAAAVTIEAAAGAVTCRRTRWASTAAIRLRFAEVDLSDAVLEHPVSISNPRRPFTVDGEPAEQGMRGSRSVRIVSLRGVDAAHLVLTDVDLTHCRFAGTIHLDQLRLEGLYRLAEAPPGLHRHGMRLVRYTPRRTLIEEHYWRATQARRDGWKDGWSAPDGIEDLQPAALAPIYRQLRKSFEDGKHEPGAADFYYGEMEMRRHAHDIPRSERTLLTAYWALSGYGLRASRALLWLLTAMTATVLAMLLWGVPQNNPAPASPALTASATSPADPSGPYQDRMTGERLDKSLRVVINSVIFRSSDQGLTTAGTYIEMASRLTEPVLLGLAALAVRNRVKR